MTKRINPADYLDHPEKAVALLNEVLSSGGSDRAIQQAVAVLIRSLARASFCDGRRVRRPSERMGRPRGRVQK